MSTEVRLFEDHERGRTDENHGFRHQIIVFNVDGGCFRAREATRKKGNTDTKLKLANVKEAMRALEVRVSADRLLMLSAVEDYNSAQDHLGTKLARFQIAERELITALDQHKEYPGSL